MRADERVLGPASIFGATAGLAPTAELSGAVRGGLAGIMVPDGQGVLLQEQAGGAMDNCHKVEQYQHCLAKGASFQWDITTRPRE